MIINLRHTNPKGNQKYFGNINVAPVSGYPTSILVPIGPGVKGNITNTLEFLPNPLNAVIAGQQPGQLEEIPAKVKIGLHGIIKKIFGE